MDLKASLSRIINTAVPTLRRFWVPVGLTVALTITLSTLITGNFNINDVPFRAALSLIPGILTAWCAILFWEREDRGEKRPIGLDSELTGNLLALPAAGLFVGLTYILLGDFTMVSLSRHAAICLFLFFACFVVPNLGKQGSLEMYIVRLFAHAVVSALFAAITFMGISAIVLTISSLFSLTLSPYTYIRIWLVMAVTVAPFLFMAGIPKGTVSPNTHDYPKVLKNLVLFVVTPLLTTYTLVLYVYFAKILITREWPVGLVSHLVLWYSMAGSALLFFIWPLSQENKWGDAFSRHFPKAVVPLLFMMFASVGIRISHYGITENRYYVLVFGAWVLGAMMYLIVTKTRKSLVLPVSLALVVILSVLGPWSSFSVSKWSQNRRFEALLTQYGMLQGGAIVPATEQVPQEDRREFAEILFYFDDSHSLADVRALPAGFQMGEFEKVFGFSYSEVQSPKTRRYVSYEREAHSSEISGYEYFFDFRGSFDKGPVLSLTQGDVKATYNFETRQVQVTFNDNLAWEQSLLDHIESLKAKYEEPGDVQFLPEDMVIVRETANLRIKLVITSLWGDWGVPGGPDVDPQIRELWFQLFVGEK